MKNIEELEVRKDIYWFLWVVQRLLDDGKDEDLDIVIDKCDNGLIIEYLFEKYRISEQNNPFSIESETINYLYSNIGFSKSDINSKYLVYQNGLVYLSVVAIEWLYSGFTHLY